METVKHAIEAKRKVLEDYDDTHEMEELKQIEAKIKAKETELAENRKNADTAEGNILRKLDELYSDLKEMIQFAEPKNDEVEGSGMDITTPRKFKTERETFRCNTTTAAKRKLKEELDDTEKKRKNGGGAEE